jgi:hypothetical protein
MIKPGVIRGCSQIATATGTTPISAPGEFGQLEVPQVEVVDGRPILVFSVGATEVGLKRRALHPDLPSGTYVCPGVSLLGPFDLEHDARLVSDLYSGRLVRRRDGVWALLGFANRRDLGPRAVRACPLMMWARGHDAGVRLEGFGIGSFGSVELREGRGRHPRHALAGT